MLMIRDSVVVVWYAMLLVQYGELYFWWYQSQVTILYTLTLRWPHKLARLNWVLSSTDWIMWPFHIYITDCMELIHHLIEAHEQRTPQMYRTRLGTTKIKQIFKAVLGCQKTDGLISTQYIIRKQDFRLLVWQILLGIQIEFLEPWGLTFLIFMFLIVCYIIVYNSFKVVFVND